LWSKQELKNDKKNQEMEKKSNFMDYTVKTSIHIRTQPTNSSKTRTPSPHKPFKQKEHLGAKAVAKTSHSNAKI